MGSFAPSSMRAVVLRASRSTRLRFPALGSLPCLTSTDEKKQQHPLRCAQTRGIAGVPASIIPAAAPVLMSAAEASAIVTFLKIAPVVSCQVLWAAPYPTIKAVEEKGTTEGLPPLGYFAMMTNGFLWVCYGYTSGMDMTIITPNAVGLVAGAYYSSKFLKYDSGQFDVQPYKLGSAAAIAGIAGVTAFVDIGTAKTILGFSGVAVCLAMFGGPLQVLKEVIDTKSTKNLPAPMAVATVVNCSLWSSYGVLLNDPFIYFPNGLGLASGIAQCTLLAKFGIHKEVQEPEPTSAEVEEPVKPK